MGVMGVKASVSPSAGACASTFMPITPEPPSRETTTTLWPSCLRNSSASVRAMTSVELPAAQGLMRVSGRDGKGSCAAARVQPSAIRAASHLRVVMRCLLVVV
jgi:hypothetical protein